MDSNLLARIHGISVMLFLLTYVIKTVLLFTNKRMLERYAKMTKVPEMIISFLFLVTGIWLFLILGGIKVLQIIKLIFVFAAIPIAVVGFKKMKKGLALLSLILIVGAYGMSEASKNKPFIPAKVQMAGNADAASMNGAKLFMQNCAFCHGNDGKKHYRNAPDLSTSVMVEKDVEQMIREGSKGKMPSYTVVINDIDITAIAGYVQHLHTTATPQ